MTLSVAMATCDGVRYLDEQLATIAGQDRLPDELVVVDDASTDRTVERLRAFGVDAPFPVHLHEVADRSGPTASFQRAIEACTGSVVALCDQDDRWYPGKLATLEAQLVGGPALLAFSDADLIEADGGPRSQSLWSGVGFQGRRRAAFTSDPLAVLLNRSTVSGCATAFRAELAEAALPFPPELAMAASPMLHDRWLALVAASLGDVVAVPERLLAYRVHDDQVTGVHRRPGGAHVPALLHAEAGRPIGGPVAAAEATLAQLDALADRVGAHGAGPPALRQIDAARRHAARRAGLAPRRRDRVADVARGVADGGYRRFGSGGLSVVADLSRSSGTASAGGRPAEGPVVFLNHAANETGPPIVLLGLLRWLAEHEPGCRHLTVHGAGGNLLPRFEALGDVVVLRHRWSPETLLVGGLERAGRTQEARRLGLEGAKVRLRGALRERPAVVVVNALAPVNITSLRVVVERYPDVPVVLHVHEMAVILEHRLDPDDLRFALDAADHLVVVSEAVRAHLHDRHGVADERMTTVHEFIEEPADAGERGAQATRVRSQLGLSDDAPLVLACGSTDWRKAPDLFLRTAWEQRRRRPDLETTWVWVGNTRNAYEDHLVDFELDRLDLRDHVHFVGVKADPGPWFAAADVFLLPSREDPFPLVCLEAGAAGTPIVCFDAGGMPELVQPEDAGVVVPYPDVEAMADAVAALIDDPVARRRQGENAERAVRSGFLVEHLAPRFWEVVQAVRLRCVP